MTSGSKSCARATHYITIVINSVNLCGNFYSQVSFFIVKKRVDLERKRFGQILVYKRFVVDILRLFFDEQADWYSKGQLL